MAVQAVVIVVQRAGQVAAQTTARVGAVAGRVVGRGAAKGAQAAGKAAGKGAQGAARGAGAAGRGAASAGRGAGQAARAGRPGTKPPTGRPGSRGPARGGPGGPQQPKTPLKKDAKGLRGQLEKAKPNVKARAKRRLQRNLRGQLRDQLRGGNDNNKNKDPNLLQGDGIANAAGRLAKQTPRKALRFAKKRIKRLLLTKDGEKALEKTKKSRKLVRRLILVQVLALVLAFVAPLVFILFSIAGSPDEETLEQQAAAQMGMQFPGAIPVELLPEVARATGIAGEALSAYSSAAGSYPIEWIVLAGVGWAECEHGTNRDAGCAPRYSVNGAGARGPMQHLGDIWRVGRDRFDAHVEGPPSPEGAHYSVGFAADGDGDGVADPWNWYDAAHGAAREMTTYRQELLQADDARYQDWKYTIAAYNAGVGGVTDAGGVPAGEATAHNAKALAEIERIRAAVADIDLGPAGDFGPPPAGARTVQTANGPLDVVDLRVPAGGETLTVSVEIAAQVQALIDAAWSDGVKLVSVSSFRTYQEQIASRKRNCGTSHYAIYEMPSMQCDDDGQGSPVAIPGQSRHERGVAIDFGCAGSSLMTTSTSCFRWLDANAGKYGLHVLDCGLCEPWHWSEDAH